MQNQEYKVGDRHQISTKNFSGIGKITNIELVRNDEQHGILLTFDLEGYGLSNEFYEPSDHMLISQISERQSRSDMPVEYVYKTATDFDWTLYGEDVGAQKKIANAFVLNFKDFQKEGRGLYIKSCMRGTGKTMLSCCLANEVLKKHDLSIKFVGVTDYIELVKDKSDDGRNRINALMDAGLLILDDIGAQVENKEWITTALYRLVDHRYTNHLPTIFTSNVNIEDLKTDSRISDRIYAVSIPLVMPEINIRRQLADKHTLDFLKTVI